MTDVVNVGAAPNDGTGDALRAAFVAINQRFLQTEGLMLVNARYIGALSANPTARYDGTPLQTGDYYVNTSTNRFRVYLTSEWVEVEDVDAKAAADAAAASATAAADSAATATTARDSAQVNAKGADTIAAARALVADTETFNVYPPGAFTFQSYRRNSSTTETFLGEYPSASAAILTSGNVLGTAIGFQASAEAFNGAVTTSSGGVFVGFTIPANAGTGDTTYITRFFDATALIGKTVDFVSTYTVNSGFITNCPARASALQVRINGVTTTVSTSSGASRTITQVGTELTVKTRYTVPAGTTDVGVLYQVAATSTTQTFDRSIEIVSASYILVPGAGSSVNDVMFDAKLEKSFVEILDGFAYNTTVIQAGATRTYTTPKAANDAIVEATALSRTEIALDAGTYSTDPEGWTLAQYATIKGYGSTKPVIHYAGADGDTHANNETFWIKRDAVIDGVRVTIRNGRYAIHAESGSIANGATQDCKVVIKNSEVEHFGNVNNNWATQSAWGSGISSGWHVRSENNIYRAPTSAFFYHTNSGFSKPTLVENIGDTFINTNNSANSNIAIDIQPMGSGQKDQHRLIGCTIDGMLRYTVYAWQHTTIDYQPANHCEIECSGYGNTPAVFRVTDFGRALRIRAVAGAGSSVIVSGDAVPVIFGTVRSFPGVENLPAYIDGTFDVSGVGVGPSANIFITSLGKRLGNCTSVNKTLTVTVNGGAPTSIVFNQDYTNVDNATVIAAIQSAVGATSLAVVDTYAPGELYHPRLTDEERTLYNPSATIGIPKGSVLAFDGSRKFVRLMTSSDAASLFAGVALEDIYPLTFGRVKTRGWLWLPYVRMSAGSLTFGATMSVGATPGRVDAGGSQGLLRAVRTEAVEVAP